MLLARGDFAACARCWRAETSPHRELLTRNLYARELLRRGEIPGTARWRAFTASISDSRASFGRCVSAVSNPCSCANARSRSRSKRSTTATCPTCPGDGADFGDADHLRPSLPTRSSGQSSPSNDQYSSESSRVARYASSESSASWLDLRRFTCGGGARGFFVGGAARIDGRTRGRARTWRRIPGTARCWRAETFSHGELLARSDFRDLTRSQTRANLSGLSGPRASDAENSRRAHAGAPGASPAPRPAGAETCTPARWGGAETRPHRHQLARGEFAACALRWGAENSRRLVVIATRVRRRRRFPHQPHHPINPVARSAEPSCDAKIEKPPEVLTGVPKSSCNISCSIYISHIQAEDTPSRSDRAAHEPSRREARRCRPTALIKGDAACSA
ncbi:hypothetical protein BH09MYX1_BH09MYX1_13670 [soil metagenome]